MSQTVYCHDRAKAGVVCKSSTTKWNAHHSKLTQSLTTLRLGCYGRLLIWP